MLSLNFWNLLFTVINVLILYAVLKKFLFKPVEAIMEKRRELIACDLKEANESRKRAEELIDEYERKLSQAKEESKGMVQNARAAAEQERENILDQTRRESGEMLEKAKAAIASQQERAQQEAREEIAGLAVLAARKILEAGGNYDTDSH